MSIRADFRWTDSDLNAFFSRIVDGWPDHRQAILDALAEDLAGGVRREIPTSSGAAKSTVRTVEGTGRRSNQVVAGGKRGVDYIEPLLEGSEPHAPGPPTPEANPSLARWARRNDYPGGFDSIYWSIYHYGTEEHDFLSGPLDDTQQRADRIAKRVLRRREVLD